MGSKNRTGLDFQTLIYLHIEIDKSSYTPCALDEDPIEAANIPTWATPPYVDDIRDTFNSSMNFGDMENPWIS